MRRVLTSFLVAMLIVLFGQATVTAQFLYSIDDGTSETRIGNGVAFVNWGNMFEVDAMGPTLENIAVGLGGNTDGISIVGDNLEWRVFNDDDGDPTSGLVELAGGSHSIENESFTRNGMIDFIDIPDVDISGGNFVFIAVTYDATVVANTFPAAIDQGTDLLQSWIGASADPSDFSAAAMISSFAIPGNWIIRGNVDPVTSNALARFDDDTGVLDSADPLPAVVVEDGAMVSDLTQVGLAAFTNAATWPVGTWAAGYDPNIYISVTITPEKSSQVNLGQILWSPGFFNSTGGGVRSSLDDFASDIASPVINPFPTPTTFDVSSLTEISEAIELRIYFSGAGTFSDLGTAGDAGGLAITGIVKSGDFLLGDVNCDGVVDLLDVAPFVALITGGGFLDKADINDDGVVSLLDVVPFVDLLLGN